MADDMTPDDVAADTEAVQAAAEDELVIPQSIPDDPVLAGLVGAFPAVVVTESEGEAVAHVPSDVHVAFLTAARDAGYRSFVDLCAVDYLRRRPRFEIIVTVLSHSRRHRLRTRTGVEGLSPHLATITGVFPGANFYEREAYDLFGIEFDGHPDLTRILLPDDWEGHPLRKDVSVGSVPVQFKGAHKAS
jgi:NADH-quinone oxidoreductase subunit C